MESIGNIIMKNFISKIIFSLLMFNLIYGENNNSFVTCKKENFFHSDGNCSTNIKLYFPKSDGPTLDFNINFKHLDKVTLLCVCAMLTGRLSCIRADYKMQLDDGVFTAYNLKCTEGEFYIRYSQDRDIPCTSLRDLNTTTNVVTTTNGVQRDSTGLPREATIGLAVGIPSLMIAVALIIFVWKRCKKRSNQEGKPSEFIRLPQKDLTNVAIDV